MNDDAPTPPDSPQPAEPPPPRVANPSPLVFVGVALGFALAFAAGYLAGAGKAREPLPAPAAAQDEPPAQASLGGGETPALQVPRETSATAPERADAAPAEALDEETKRGMLEEARELAKAEKAAREAAAARNAPTEKALREGTLSVNFDATPFGQALDFFRDVTKLNVVVSRDAQDLIESESIEVSLRLRGITWRNGLRLMLAAHEDLAYQLRDGIVCVVTGDELAPEPVLEVYDVSDIVSGEARKKGGFSLGPEGMIETLEEFGGEDEDGSLEYVSGTLIARKSDRFQKRIAWLLDYLRTGKTERHEAPEWVQGYEKLLRTRKVTLNFPDTPLSEVVSFLQDISGLNIVIGAGVDAEEVTVRLRVKEVLLGDALDLILEQANLGRGYRNASILIETPDSSAVRGPFSYRIYEALDLLEWISEPDVLEEIVVNGVGEDLWDDPASLRVHRGQLFVNQSEAGHLAVQRLLARLRVSRAKGEKPR